TKYTSPALTQKVFANIKRVSKGFSGVETPLFDAMLVQQQVQDNVAEVEEDDDNKICVAPPPPSPTPSTTPPPPQQEHIPLPPQAQSAQPSSPPQQQPSQTTNISESLMTLLNKLMETCATLTQKVDNLEQDKIDQALEITKLKQRVKKLEKKMGFKSSGFKILKKDTDEAKPAKVEEVLEVVTAAKGVIIQDPEETAASVIVYTEAVRAELNANINKNDVIDQVKRREKQDNTVMRYQALKRKPMTKAQARKNMMIYLKNMAGFKMDFFK
nr:hypothetical protein [Tanacetum cinerariifolium]